MNNNEINYVNELKLTYTRAEFTLNNKELTLNNSASISSFLRNVFDENDLIIDESFYAVYLNQALKIVGFQKIGVGGYSVVSVENRKIFTTALLIMCSSVVIAHNHPSGTLKPSQADKILTNNIKEGLQLLSIRLLDHIILTELEYYSFADEGLI